MQFRLKKPCTNCPWRNDRYPFFGRDERGHARAQEIADSIRGMHVFPCHKTARFDEETGDQYHVENTQACAGALATMRNGEELGQLARISVRLGLFDPDTIEPDQPVYGSLDEWVAAHDPQDT